MFSQSLSRLLFAEENDTEGAFPERAPRYRVKALILSAASGFLLLFALGANIYEQNHAMYVPLSIMIGIVLLSVTLALKNKGLSAVLLICLSLIALGVYLLFFYDLGQRSKLFWFLLFPPMLLYCLGLFYGSLLFFSFFVILLVTFFGPAGHFLANEYSVETTMRFVAAMFGAWMFASLSEYSRYRIGKKLARVMNRLEHDSLTDSLTGLGNRRDFETFFNCVQANALREGQRFCVVIIDIDHFKSINDRYGHSVGDEVLRHTAQVLNRHIRAGGRLFRWGGEEFVTIMTDIAGEEACQVSERLRLSVAESPYRQGNLSISYTISLGLYCGDPATEMCVHMDNADTMLYKAKSGGRNQVQSRLSGPEETK